MKTDDFDFDLPENLIAQTPLEKRDSSKLLVMNKSNGNISHHTFSDIVDLIPDNSVLVLNNSRVIPARIFGTKIDTGANIELLLLSELESNWEALVKPAKRVKIGTKISFGNEKLIAECIKVKDDGIRIFKLSYNGILLEILEELGQMPLPPYITEKLSDTERYQTVYSKHSGSAAAPTAGLHFTNELLDKLSNKGIQIEYVTLHVGLGTFRPVKVENILEHKMHSEFYNIDEETAARLNEAVKNKKNIICVGTTSTRVLETNFNIETSSFTAKTDYSDIFIYPGYKFKVVDSLITNFHLPKSTLLMLISAFSNKDNIFNAYSEAIKYDYRFFSFGDSMFIKKES